jgi:hypothetical protein
MEHCSNFEYDLKMGLEAEEGIADIFNNKRIEIKRDMRAMKTGNVFIEYESRGKPSGIAKTMAEVYCFVVGDLVLFYPTDKLKDMIRPLLGGKRDILGGDNNTSKGVLLKLTDLIPRG